MEQKNDGLLPDEIFISVDVSETTPKKWANTGAVFPEAQRYIRADLAQPKPQCWEVEQMMQDLFGNIHKGGFIADLCYTVWSKCHHPTHEDGNTDWFNDTKPTVDEGKRIIREKVEAILKAAQQPAEDEVGEKYQDQLGGIVGMLLATRMAPTHRDALIAAIEERSRQPCTQCPYKDYYKPCPMCLNKDTPPPAAQPTKDKE